MAEKAEPKIMANVVECPHPQCGYTTNVVGDLSRHRAERHSSTAHSRKLLLKRRTTS